MTTKKFREGQKVVLPANKSEGWKREKGVIVGPSGPTTYLVQVRPTEVGDDGLREVATTGIREG